MPSRRPPQLRTYWILGRLRDGRSFTAKDVAGAFEITDRTAYRDLVFLRDQLNVPLHFERPKRTWRLTEPTAVLPGLPFCASEWVALYFAEKILAQYRGTPFEPDLLAAFGKMRALLPDEITVVSSKVLPHFSVDLGPAPRADRDPAVFRAVLDGLSRQTRLLVRYDSLSRGRATDRVIEPYHVFNVRGDWYVAAFDHVRKEVRDFALHRIRKVTLTGEVFERDPAFDFKQYMADTLGIEKGGRAVEVAIRFAPRQARWIRERQWHKTQRVQDHERAAALGDAVRE